jgi:hypothetical protein
MSRPASSLSFSDADASTRSEDANRDDPEEENASGTQISTPCVAPTGADHADRAGTVPAQAQEATCPASIADETQILASAPRRRSIESREDVEHRRTLVKVASHFANGDAAETVPSSRIKSILNGEAYVSQSKVTVIIK